MILLVFDVDGTLTDTSAVDKLCYNNTFVNQFNQSLEDLQFMDYDQVTDNGLVMQVMKQYFDKDEPEWTDFLKAKSGFFLELMKSHQESPDLFKQIPGGAAMWERMSDAENVQLAVATGCWEMSAIFKLEKAGYDLGMIPFSHNDSSLTRSDILLDAIHQSKLFYQNSRYEKIIYVADGVWDFHVTQELGVPLIGIDVHQDGKLKELGCEHVMKDYTDMDLFIDYISQIE